MVSMMEKTMGKEMFNGVKKVKNIELDLLTKTSKAFVTCEKLVGAAAEMDAALLAKSDYTPKPLLEAFATVKPVVALCKTFVKQHDSVAEHIEQLNVCFGLDDSIFGSIKHIATFASNLFTDGSNLRSCLTSFANVSEHEARFNNFSKAYSDVESYWAENETELQAAANIMINSEQYFVTA